MRPSISPSTTVSSAVERVAVPAAPASAWTSKRVNGIAVLMPSFPPESRRITSAAVAEVAVAKTISVLFTVAVNVASASAQMLAPGRIASVPSDSSGA